MFINNIYNGNFLSAWWFFEFSQLAYVKFRYRCSPCPQIKHFFSSVSKPIFKILHEWDYCDCFTFLLKSPQKFHS